MSPEAPEETVDVVVVGAGLAGLLATWRLRAAGLSVRTFEARDRLGGRLHRPTAEAVDLGASWVWEDEPHVLALLQELGLSTFDHHRAGTDLYEDGHRLQAGRLPRSAVPERRVEGGTAAIVAALSHRAGAIELGCGVHKIDAVADALHVHTRGGMQPASTVLAALPPALLAATVDLPGLTAEARSTLLACPTWMEDVAKVVVRYPRRFWRDAGLSGRAASRVGPLMELHDLSGPGGQDAALFGFLPRVLHTPDWREAVLSQLVRLFGDAAAHPEAVYATAWWTEPCTSVARSQPPIDRLMGHPVLRKPLLGGRLHLISTETAPTRAGHMEGVVARVSSVVAELIDRRDRP